MAEHALEERDVDKNLVARLIKLTQDNRIVWIDCTRFGKCYNLQAHYKDIHFIIALEGNNSPILRINSYLYNTHIIEAPAISDLVKIAEDQLRVLSQEKRAKISAELLSRTHIQNVLDLLA